MYVIFSPFPGVGVKGEGANHPYAIAGEACGGNESTTRGERREPPGDDAKIPRTSTEIDNSTGGW